MSQFSQISVDETNLSEITQKEAAELQEVFKLYLQMQNFQAAYPIACELIQKEGPCARNYLMKLIQSCENKLDSTPDDLPTLRTYFNAHMTAKTWSLLCDFLKRRIIAVQDKPSVLANYYWFIAESEYNYANYLQIHRSPDFLIHYQNALKDYQNAMNNDPELTAQCKPKMDELEKMGDSTSHVRLGYDSDQPTFANKLRV